MKKTAFWIALDLVFLMVFNLAFFLLIGTDNSASVWIAYASVHFAYFLLLSVPLFIRKGTQSEYMMGLPLTTISFIYFMIVLGLAVFFFVKKTLSTKTTIILFLAVFGVYAVLMLINMLANENTAEKEEMHREELSYLKGITTSVKLLLGKTGDKAADKEVERLYDALCASPMKSLPEIGTLESSIRDTIAKMADAVTRKDIERVTELSQTARMYLERRNALLQGKNR